jgi:hypothetical protein
VNEAFFLKFVAYFDAVVFLNAEAAIITQS